MKRYLIALVLLINLSGCSLFKQKSAPVLVAERAPLALPDPAPVDLKEVKFIVVTPDTAAEIFSKMKEPVFFGLSGDDYKALAENIMLIQHQLILQRKVTESYREYYEKKK